MSVFKEIEFGNANANTDELLYQCFVDTNSLRTALSLNTYFIIGRKGSGKTAMTLIIDKWLREPLPNHPRMEWSLPIRRLIQEKVHDTLRISPAEIGAGD